MSRRVPILAKLLLVPYSILGCFCLGAVIIAWVGNLWRSCRWWYGIGGWDWDCLSSRLSLKCSQLRTLPLIVLPPSYPSILVQHSLEKCPLLPQLRHLCVLTMHFPRWFLDHLAQGWALGRYSTFLLRSVSLPPFCDGFWASCCFLFSFEVHFRFPDRSFIRWFYCAISQMIFLLSKTSVH